MQNEGGCMGAVPLMSAQRILNRRGGGGGMIEENLGCQRLALCVVILAPSNT